MPYAVEYTAEAEADLDAMPPLVASFTLDEIDRLAADPVGLGGPSYFPFLPNRQVFETRYDGSEGTYFLRVFFRYQPDEATITVLAIGAQSLGGA
jgi:mRNA-degrading endonuclease RelE of RelBE toxin-antitoxin system